MARIPEVVLDASVILKWFLKEDLTEEALIFKNKFYDHIIEITVPSLIFYEVFNVLRFKPDFAQKNLKEIVEIFEGMQLNEVQWSSDWGNKTVKLAYHHGITVYDASYLALARHRKCPLITADEKFLRKIQPSKQEFLLRDFNHSNYLE